MPTREPLDVRVMRSVLIHWPFPRGKGILMRCFRPRLLGRDFPMQVTPEVFVAGELSDWMLVHLFMHGWTRDPAFPFSWSLVQPGMTVIDVGGNIGLWSLPAARRAGSKGQVHAFEPFPVNIDRFRRNVQLSVLDNVSVHACAVSDHEGFEMFYAPAGENSGLGRLAANPGRVQEYDRVRLVSLDEYLPQKGLSSVDFIKVDVEGAELHVFRGASRLLAATNAPMLMFELNRDLAAAFSSTPADIDALLRSFGYRIFRLVRSRLQEFDVSGHTGHEDLFAFRPEHFDLSPALRTARGDS